MENLHRVHSGFYWVYTVINTHRCMGKNKIIIYKLYGLFFKFSIDTTICGSRVIYVLASKLVMF